MTQVLVDTGPLVAYFDQSSRDHHWAQSQFKRLIQPLVTCEAVVTETLFLLKRDRLNPDWVLDLIERDELICLFGLRQEISSIRKLLHQYRDLPSTLADVCLVRMATTVPNSVIMTLDKDFLIYRRNGRQKIPLLAPFVTAGYSL